MMTEIYPLVKLADLIQLTQGFKFTTEHFADEGIPLIKIGNIKHGRIDFEVVDYINEDYRDLLAVHFAKNNEILIAITGSGPTNRNSIVGKVARYRGPEEYCFVNQRVARIKDHDTGRLDLGYLYFILLRDHFLSAMRSGIAGTAQANIRFEQILDYKIALPPLTDQNVLSEFLDKIVIRTELAYAKISVLEDLLCGATELAIGQGIDKLIRQGNGAKI